MLPVAQRLSTPFAMLYNTGSKPCTKDSAYGPHLSPPLVSGLIGAALLILPLLLPVVEPSSALRSRNPVHRSASDSLVAGGSVKNSVDSEGVLGVR